MRILIILLSISFVACGQQNKKYATNTQAKFLADSANKIIKSNPSDTGNLQSAISLLKKAVQIDTNFFLGYQSLYTYQMMFKKYSDAVVTAKKISDLRPQNPEYITRVGFTYELNSDTISSKPYFQKAVNIYSNIIDTLSDNRQIVFIKMSKAFNLLFLNHYQEGQAIIKELIQNSKDSTEREGLKLFLNKTGHDIIFDSLNGGTQSISAHQQ